MRTHGNHIGNVRGPLSLFLQQTGEQGWSGELSDKRGTQSLTQTALDPNPSNMHESHQAT